MQLIIIQLFIILNEWIDIFFKWHKYFTVSTNRK